MRKVFLFGDSHSLVFRNVAPQFRESDKRIFFANCIGPGRVVGDFVYNDVCGERCVTPLLTVRMEENNLYPYERYKNGLSKRIVLLLGSAEGVRISLNKKWDAYWYPMPEMIDTPPKGVEIVPYQVMYDFIKWRLRYFFEGLDMLVEEGYTNLELLEGPPPHAKNERIVKLYSKKREDAQKLKPASPTNRLKLHLLVGRVFEDYCESKGLIFIRNPKEVMDEEGFLLPEYERDGVHSNAAFAEKVTQHIIDMEAA